ncbi:MAG: hypothetical protein ACRDWE_14480 [Acidimicrobiales bacterium]
MDVRAAMEQGFSGRLAELLTQDERIAEAFERLTDDEAVALGRRAAEDVLAPLYWAGVIGDRWDVQHASKFLDISRQALYKRVRGGSALGVRGQGTTYFPVWQFDPKERIVRAIVAHIIDAFSVADPDVDPLVIAAWANTPNEQLDGLTPAAWITGGRDDGRVIGVARRAASPLAA